MTKKTKREPGVWLDADEVRTTYGTLRQAMKESHELERAFILDHLEQYLELTRFSQEVEGASVNAEWDAGFNAALALIRELGK